jgi:2-amino-4-hydroxy-6-hydroxymethyldihydropteridine diphosphokinase
LQGIEKELGKVPKPQWAPRPIDLDLLFLGNEIRRKDNLTLPHPLWSVRPFVLRPLLDLVDRIEFSGTTYPLKEMLETLEVSS